MCYHCWQYLHDTVRNVWPFLTLSMWQSLTGKVSMWTKCHHLWQSVTIDDSIQVRLSTMAATAEKCHHYWHYLCEWHCQQYVTIPGTIKNGNPVAKCHYCWQYDYLCDTVNNVFHRLWQLVQVFLEKIISRLLRRRHIQWQFLTESQNLFFKYI